MTEARILNSAQAMCVINAFAYMVLKKHGPMVFDLSEIAKFATLVPSVRFDGVKNKETGEFPITFRLPDSERVPSSDLDREHLDLVLDLLRETHNQPSNEVSK